MSKYADSLRYFAWSVLGFELFMIFLYSYFVRPSTSPVSLKQYYPWFQDINVMMLIGFGFLMTFIRSYSWGAVGLTFMVNALVVQWYVIMHGLWDKIFTGPISSATVTVISVDTKTLIFCSYAVAAVLITFGALIGRVSPSQLMFVALFEIVFYSLSEKIVYYSLSVVDAGGSIVIHTFGAYFGLAVSYMIGRKHPVAEKTPASSYSSNMFAMIGTLFLWMFWPSFNSGALAVSTTSENVIRLSSIINTLLSLTGSCLTSFAMSKLLRNKFDMEDALNATLAGGVIIGAPCSIILNPVAALAIGCGAGLISTAGFARMTSQLNSSIYDVCGIHNLHALPGILGGLLSAVLFGFYINITTPSTKVNPDSPYDYSKQAGMQVAGTFVSLGIALASGLMTGGILRWFDNPDSKDYFEDKVYWEIPEAKAAQEQKPKDISMEKPTMSGLFDNPRHNSMEILVH